MSVRDHRYFVYIVASRSRQLYVGMTNSIMARVAKHRQFQADAYTARYRIDPLVCFEETRYVLNAIDRETQIKAWTREKKVELIERENPAWEDLADGWFGGGVRRQADSSAAPRNDNKKGLPDDKQSALRNDGQ